MKTCTFDLFNITMLCVALVDGRMLFDLTPDMVMKDLGVPSELHMRRILNEVDVLRYGLVLTKNECGLLLAFWLWLEI